MRAYSIFALTLASFATLAPFTKAQETAKPRTVIQQGSIIDADDDSPAKVAELVRLNRSRNAFTRLVRDIATWDFGWLAANPNWVLAEITPPAAPTLWEVKQSNPRILAPLEPTAIVRLDTRTKIVFITEGTIKVLTALGTEPEKSLWPYHHEQMLTTTTGGAGGIASLIGSEAREAYSPFHQGPIDGQTRNLAFCLIPETIQNVETSNVATTFSAKFLRAHLITEEILQWVEPAQRFYEANRALFAPENVPTNRTALLELLDSPNPFLFAAASRTLAQSGQMWGKYVSAKLLEADRFHQALFVYSTLYYSPKEEGEVMVGLIQKSIEKAANKTQLEGLVLGTNSALETWRDGPITDYYKKVARNRNYLAPEPVVPQPPSLTLFRSLLKPLADKQKEFGITTENDRYLLSLTDRMAPPPRLRIPPHF